MHVYIHGSYGNVPAARQTQLAGTSQPSKNKSHLFLHFFRTMLNQLMEGT